MKQPTLPRETIFTKDVRFMINPRPKHPAIRLERTAMRQLQRAVLERDHNTCQVCGCHTEAPPHHVILRGRGGSDIASNLTALCGPAENDCHDGFHKRAEWRGWMKDGKFCYEKIA